MQRYYAFRARVRPKRNVKKGEVVLTSEPFVYAVAGAHRLIYCDQCLASSQKKALYTCPNCQFLRYCSKDCERKASDIHRFECPALKRMAPDYPTESVRLLARLIFILRNGGEKKVEKFSEKEGRKFRDLMNHYSDIKVRKDYMNDVEKMIKDLKAYIGESFLPNESDFLGIYGRVMVNRFCLHDEELGMVGSGLYLAASIFDHACIPNCSFSFDGTKVVIRALTDIDDFSFNKCRISYIDPLQGTKERRDELYKFWFFWCDCKPCHDEERLAMENTIKCENEHCLSPVTVPEDARSPPPTCTRCGGAVDPQTLKKYNEIIAYTKKTMSIMSREDNNYETCYDLLEKQGSVLSSMNIWRCRTLDFAFNAAINNGCFSLAFDYGDENKAAMRFYYGPDHPAYGVFLLHLAKAKFYNKEYKEGLEHIREAEPILKVAYGASHPLISEELSRLTYIAYEDVEFALTRRLEMARKRDKDDDPRVVRVSGPNEPLRLGNGEIFTAHRPSLV
ncbi:histone-lysine N-methyltransferase SMYD3-like isoform X1 [Penaeus chinensis]|uniref:histone-lysine N-methyltransferase SMYD3-like isoform X1 n=1 Tax=Penaeus chinensis TaxID=139456 RepID=UPI001FB5D263|nr:histone-lysine N-methyltransferase SMYD3-like isoform X1 [Penaeus chinensis]